MAVLLGIDVGTTNWKVAAFNEAGSLLSIRKTPTITRYDEEGMGYYDPEEIWESIARLLRETTEVLAGRSVDAVAVTSMAESVMAVDGSGKC